MSTLALHSRECVTLAYPVVKDDFFALGLFASRRVNLTAARLRRR